MKNGLAKGTELLMKKKARRLLRLVHMRVLASDFTGDMHRLNLPEEYANGLRVTLDLDEPSGFRLAKALIALRMLKGVVVSVCESPSGRGYHIVAVVPKTGGVEMVRRMCGDDATRIYLDRLRPRFLRQILFDEKGPL